MYNNAALLLEKEMIKRHFTIQMQAIENAVNSEVKCIIEINVPEQKYFKNQVQIKRIQYFI